MLAGAISSSGEETSSNSPSTDSESSAHDVLIPVGESSGPSASTETVDESGLSRESYSITSSGSGSSSSGSSSGDESEAESGSNSGESGEGGEVATVQLDMPRRSLQLTFTCNKCSAVTTRMINRIAWEKGLVFAQCNGCKVWHNIKDAAGLVEEFRFKDGKEVDPADY